MLVDEGQREPDSSEAKGAMREVIGNTMSPHQKLEPDRARRKGGSRWWLIALVAVVALQLVSFFSYWRDQRYLERLFDQIASPTLPPSEQAKKLAIYLWDKSYETNESYFLLPIFRFLRPTPRQVAEHGGDCADRSRFMVAMLELRDIKASKWALYSPDLRPVHAVVEVETETGKMVVDPLFGLWFPRPEGGYYGIEDLRANPRILPARTSELLSWAQRPFPFRIESYDLDEYIYTNARSINWGKSRVTEFLYRILHKLRGEKVNRIERPGITARPALMLIVGLVPLEGGILAAWLAARFRSKKPSDPRVIAETSARV